MHCPICRNISLEDLELEQDLNAARCESCTGVWISKANYDAWRTEHPAEVPETTPAGELAVTDLPQAKICPGCGHLMLKYRIGHGVNFAIDHCGACGGFWLDGAEWTALKQHGLHDNLHQISTEQWQTDQRRQVVQEKLEQWHAAQFGAENYAKVRDFRDWLQKQPNKGVLLKYLEGAEGRP